MYMTIAEAAEYANVKYNAIWNHLTKTGKLEGYKIPTNNMWESTWRVSKESVDNLYYSVKKGTKQHVAKVPPISQYQSIYNKLKERPDLYSDIVSDDVIEASIIILKSKGYKISKPVTTWEEV
jgi:hypothetical protein